MKDNLSMAGILRWYLDAGVDETVSNVPQNRLIKSTINGETAPQKSQTNSVPNMISKGPVVADNLLNDAFETAAATNSIEELNNVLLNYTGCPLRKTATNLVFGDGDPSAKIVLIGESPGAEEDRKGLPFVGPGGKLLDKMLASIGLDRTKVFLANTVFWRPPGNRTPTNQEIKICKPFVERLIELIKPEILIILGGPAAKTMLAETAAVSRLRGEWYTYSTPKLSRPIQTTVVFHPNYLLNSPIHKRETWQDLLMINDKLKSIGLN